MKKGIFRLTILIVSLAILIGAARGFDLFKNKSTVFAIGDLTIDWGGGVMEGQPIFNIDDLAPGDIKTHIVNVSNGATTGRPVGVRGFESTPSGILKNVLFITISENSTVLYGPKTLDEFFTESSNPDGISLSVLGPTSSTGYEFKITFDPQSGNEYQDTSVKFDIHIGISVPVPAECQNINFGGRDPIFGTQGNDTIYGTFRNDLIFTFEGNDKVYAGAGNDCIVGGLGNDNLRGEAGIDVVIGNEGDDTLVGGAGNDKIFGNEGNDNIQGEADHDILKGGAGDDNINGHAGNDNLDGEAGIDKVNGSSGIDTCIGETKTLCEL